MADIGGEVFFKKVTYPSFEPVDHAAKVGVTLRSTSVASGRKRPTTPHSVRICSSRTRLSYRTKTPTQTFQTNTNNLKQIYNMVVPIDNPGDDRNLQNSAQSYSFSAERSRNQSGTLPHMMKSAYVTPQRGSRSQKSHVNSVTFFIERQSSSDGNKPVTSSYPENKARWRNKEQPRRFLNEQENLRKLKQQNKSPQVTPHRVDRMYFINGTGLNMTSRFQVDDVELQKLRDLANQRRSSNHYGRGLSRYKYFEMPTQTHLPDTFTPICTTPYWYFDEIRIPTAAENIQNSANYDQFLKYTEEEHNVFDRLLPYQVSESQKVSPRSMSSKGNRNNNSTCPSPASSLDLNKELRLDKSSSSGSYIAYHLSRAGNVAEEGTDDMHDEISAVAAENSAPDLLLNSADQQIIAKDCAAAPETSDRSVDKLTNTLHRQLCLKQSHKGTKEKQHRISVTDNLNSNNNNNTSENDWQHSSDLSKYGCGLQSVQKFPRYIEGRCSHREKFLQGAHCAQYKTGLTIKDVQFTKKLPYSHQSRRPVYLSKQATGDKDDAVLYRYNGMTGKKKSNHNQKGSANKTISGNNQARKPSLPDIALNGTLSGKDLNQKRTGDNQDSVILPRVEDPVSSQCEQYQSIVKMQALSQQYKSSFHGAFLPHSLLKARPPIISMKKRMEKLMKDRNLQWKMDGRSGVHVPLTLNSGTFCINRCNTPSPRKDGKL